MQANRNASTFGWGRFFPPTGIHFRHPRLIACLALWAAIVCLYSVMWGHNFLFDEDSIILRNPYIKKLSMLPELFQQGYFYAETGANQFWFRYYRPLTSLTFLIDYHFWKLNPFGYNLTNTALHACVSMLLFILLDRTLKGGACLAGRQAAFLTALIYAVHPVQTEAVTYIASRGDLLGALAALGCLYFYQKGRLATAAGVYLLSLFSKESNILIPLYVLFFDLAFVRSAPRRLIARIGAFAVIGVSYLLYRKYLCPVEMGPPQLDPRASLYRFLSMGPAYLDYLSALFFPEPFKLCGSVRFAKSIFDPVVPLTLGVMGLVLAGWILALRRRGAAFFGLSFFLVALGPYLQIVHFYPHWAEHYLYISGIGLTFAFAAFAREVLVLSGPRGRAVFFAVVFAFAAFFSVRTVQRNAAYNDTEAFYVKLTQSDSPYAFFGYQNLGRMAVDADRWEEAAVYFNTAIRIEPESDANHNNLGLYYLRKKRYEEAYKHFKTAYEIGTHESGFLNNAAVSLVNMGKYKDAIDAFEYLNRRDAKNLYVYINLLYSHELNGDPQRALEWGKRGQAMLIDNEIGGAVLTMAVACLAYRQGWDDLARKELDTLAKRYGGVVFYGDTAKMMTAEISPDRYREIVRSKYPTYESNALSYVLMAYVLQGRTDEARAFLRENRKSLEGQPRPAFFVEKELSRVPGFDTTRNLY